ncbi:transport and Golgi organization protein 6 [Caerostris extrusa]|uniref:Transport and Golgi organization protein 6 n=1 Tax=Caerostris extrusa TaxID=172846 RepID=A0AAV4NL88_CAEEX|nr:transport and Golgi organization protein 6 [Caerostris extrusa]
MSAKEAKIESICLCLSTLTKEIAIEPPDPSEPPNNIKNSFSQDLRRNVHSTFKRLEKYPDLKDFVSEYIEPCLGDNCTSCDYLKFLQLCLILLRTLKIALEEYELSLKKSASKEPAHNQPVNKAKLSLGQVRVFIKSLQFAVALGILPNLLRGIGIPLSKRLKHAIILEHFTSESTTYQKLIQIAVCLDTLIGCLRCDAMQSLILSYNGTDILAALIQLCHAPIKKLHETETSADIPRKGKLCFRIMLARFQDSSEHSEEQVIKMMMTLRKYFTPHLETLLKQMCPSLLMWELLLFQGIPVHPEDPDATVTKTPAWFRKLCNKMFTNLLLQENGIATLVQVVLDKSSSDFMLTSKVDAVRLEAIARLVSYNPVRHISVESYIERLSSQVISLFSDSNVFNLLHIKGSRMDGLLKYVASCIFLLFCERDIKSAEKYLLVKLLKPLWNCVRQPENIQINKIVVKEAEIANCIEDLHEIFAYSKHLLSAKYSKLLFPYSQCLCNMYFFLLRGKSFLKSKVKNIIEVILRTVSDDEVLSLLHMVSFVNKKQCGVHVTKVAFKNGEEGGIVAVQSKEEE